MWGRAKGKGTTDIISDEVADRTIRWWVHEGRVQALRIREAEAKAVALNNEYRKRLRDGI